MEHVSGLSQSKINWTELTSKIATPVALEAVGQNALSSNAEGLKISNADGRPRATAVVVPEIEAPSITSGDFDAVIEKVSTQSAFNLNEAEMAAVQEKLSANVAESLADIGGFSIGKGSLFDVYQLVALMLTVAQKQRDAAREIRQAENQSIQTSIMNQADMQRSAALAGMIAGAIVCTMQVVAQGVAIAKSASAYNRQAEIAKETGVTSAQENLKAANVEKADLLAQSKELSQIETEYAQSTELSLSNDSAADVKLEEFKQTHNIAGDTVEEVRANLDNKINAANETVTLRESELSAAESRMSSHSEFLKASNLQTKWRSLSDIFGAIGSTLQNLAHGMSDIMSSKATEKGAVRQEAEEQLDQIKDLFSQGQEVVNKVVQLLAAVIQAETQSMRDAIHA